MKKRILLIVSILALNLTDVSAQCAMCRATIESNLAEGGSSIGAGINTGILYLLVMPYLLFMVIAYLWYINSKNYHADLEAKGYIKRKMSSM